MELESILYASPSPMFFGQENETKMYIISITTTARQVRLIYSAEDKVEGLIWLMEKHSLPSNMQSLVVNIVKDGLALTYANSVPYLAERLPGVGLRVNNPVTSKTDTLFNVIMELNDRYRWSREDIADWIENTCDTKDIAFVPKEVENEPRKLSESTRLVVHERIFAG